MPYCAEVRFKNKVRRDDDGCWIWLGKIDKDGFPKFMVNWREWFVHRWAYQSFVGPLPEPCRIQQICQKKICVRPDHLYVVELHADDERFRAKYTVLENGCWQWLDVLNSSGYGTFSVNCRKQLAHRYIWEKTHGRIPKGLVIDHLCRNRGCVKIEHLEVVPPKENARRGDPDKRRGAHLREKTHCPQGHPYDQENTRIDTAGSRVCRQCGRERARERRLAKRQTANV